MEFKDISPEIETVSRHYARHEIPPWILRLQELLQKLWQFLQDLIDKFFHSRHATGAGDSRSLSTLLQYGLYFAGAIALLLICYMLFRKAVLESNKRSGSTRGAAQVEKILDSEGYRQSAEKLAGAGDFRQACRALYLCLLQEMHERKVAAFAPAKTNFEYRYLLASFPKLKSIFVSAAEIVEQLWFGNRQAGADDYAECLNLLGQASTEMEEISASRRPEQGVDS